MSIVRDNMLKDPAYRPYCPHLRCRLHRTVWNGEQMECPSCGWQSEFSADFVAEYLIPAQEQKDD